MTSEEEMIVGQQEDSNKKRVRSVRQTKEQTQAILRQIRKQLLSNLGKPVLLLKKENRGMTPYLVWLVKPAGRIGIVSIQKCYHSDGSFTKITHIISEISILIGEQEVIYFGEI